MQEIGQMITNYGFPIVMCLLLFYFIKTTVQDVKEAITKLEIAIVTLTNKLDDHGNNV